jgi:subtilisin family serine protease
VLDTGVDLTHPDFRDRDIQTSSFVPSSHDADDDHGHGTHCLGTLAGPAAPHAGPRYGIASRADVFVAKVLNAAGKGREGDILHGIGWALQHRCRVISMSFGKAIAPGTGPDPDYDQIGAIALGKNCLLVAAAGNDSARPNEIAPVEMPANARTIMAAGAIDRRLDLYRKCNGGVNANGGNIDLVAPGVDVRSTKPVSIIEYGLASGTSMAAPHVAGIAALMMEGDSSATAEQIWTRLTQRAKRLALPNADVGAGLAQVG